MSKHFFYMCLKCLTVYGEYKFVLKKLHIMITIRDLLGQVT